MSTRWNISEERNTEKSAVAAVSGAVLVGGLTVAAGAAQAGIQGSGVGIERCHAHKIAHTSHWTYVTPAVPVPVEALDSVIGRCQDPDMSWNSLDPGRTDAAGSDPAALPRTEGGGRWRP